MRSTTWESLGGFTSSDRGSSTVDLQFTASLEERVVLSSSAALACCWSFSVVETAFLLLDLQGALDDSAAADATLFTVVVRVLDTIVFISFGAFSFMRLWRSKLTWINWELCSTAVLAYCITSSSLINHCSVPALFGMDFEGDSRIIAHPVFESIFLCAVGLHVPLRPYAIFGVSVCAIVAYLILVIGGLRSPTTLIVDMLLLVSLGSLGCRGAKLHQKLLHFKWKRSPCPSSAPSILVTPSSSAMSAQQRCSAISTSSFIAPLTTSPQLMVGAGAGGRVDFSLPRRPSTDAGMSLVGIRSLTNSNSSRVSPPTDAGMSLAGIRSLTNSNSSRVSPPRAPSAHATSASLCFSQSSAGSLESLDILFTDNHVDAAERPHSPSGTITSTRGGRLMSRNTTATNSHSGFRRGTREANLANLATELASARLATEAARAAGSINCAAVLRCSQLAIEAAYHEANARIAQAHKEAGKKIKAERQRYVNWQRAKKLKQQVEISELNADEECPSPKYGKPPRPKRIHDDAPEEDVAKAEEAADAEEADEGGEEIETSPCTQFQGRWRLIWDTSSSSQAPSAWLHRLHIVGSCVLDGTGREVQITADPTGCCELAGGLLYEENGILVRKGRSGAILRWCREAAGEESEERRTMTMDDSPKARGQEIDDLLADIED